jgi:hypothetical protein
MDYQISLDYFTTPGQSPEKKSRAKGSNIQPFVRLFSSPQVTFVMKTLTFILLFLPTALLAQLHSQNVTNPELDLHRSISKINLGDTYQKWRNFLFDKEEHDIHLFSCTFKSDSCCNTVFGNSTSLVRVTFQNDTVVSIKIELKNFFEGKKLMTAADVKTAIESAVTKYAMINKRFSTLFGEPYASHSNEHQVPDEPRSMVQWLGVNTFLETNYYYYPAVYPPTRTVGPATGLTEKLEEMRDKTVITLSDRNFLKGELKSQF